jgi:CHAD domain-containing protein
MAKKGKLAETPAIQVLAASTAMAASGALVAGLAIRDRRARIAKERRFALKRREAPREGVARIALGQLDLIDAQLDGDGHASSPERVHEARKALKRLRALLRLSRPFLPGKVYQRENDTFRDTGRQLSGARDARVLIDTLDRLAPPELPTFVRLREQLERQAEQTTSPAPALLDTINEARVRVATYPLPNDGRAEQLLPGLERIYRRGRRALRRARRHSDAEHRHELRKRAKDLWHGTQLLRDLGGKRMRKLRRRAHDLSDLLGDDHDLTELRARAVSQPALFSPGELDTLLALIDRRQEELQATAMRCAAKVYRRTPKKQMKRLS